MGSQFQFGYCWRKYPLFRFFLIVLIFFIAGIVTAVINVQMRRIPVIEKIDPAVGIPGDVLRIYGKNFGDQRNSSFVEIGGSRQTSSSYIEWTDNLIRVILPADIQDGLVFVQTKDGRSEGKLFANKADIPVPVPENIASFLPVISSISKTTVVPGELISIYGTNFGSGRGVGAVYFSSSRDLAQDNTPSEYIACSDIDYDYESWTDSEIRVRVPDGAISGSVYVSTVKGNSNTKKITITADAGKKVFSHKRTYLLQLSVDITQIVAQGDASITLRIPRPLRLPYQPAVELTECVPEPLLSDYSDMVMFQEDFSKGITNRKVFSQNFAVTTYAVSTDINSKRVRTKYDTDRLLYQSAVSSDNLIQSDDPRIAELYGIITESSGANPYTRARTIYDYLIDNYTLLSDVRTGDVSVFDMLDTGCGDAYDFAMLYCMLLRAGGIPCMPLSGILISSSLSTVPHWWCEFYLEEFGWVPVDIALGAGLPFASYEQDINRRDFYFGSVDAQRVVFSRGWKEIKPSSAVSKVVMIPRSFAFQSIWEEASSQTESYSSFWSGPVVLGLY